MSPPVPARTLIVNADDFGISAGVNRGILQAHEHGIVTSASLMVRYPAAIEACALAQTYPGLSIGLHVDLCEWVFTDGEWRKAYEIVPMDAPHAIAAELERQWITFCQMVGRPPTHLDSHQHVHRSEPLRTILLSHAHREGINLRGENPHVRYCGSFYGQSNKGHPYPEGITVETLIKIIRELPPGTTELCCHPGQGTDVNSVYRMERELERDSLCDARVREVIVAENISLRSFADWNQGADASSR
jgi:chitin disaccharide deacetylase